jgi:hypothetical protein
MFTKRIFFGLLAILVIGGAVLTPSPKAYAYSGLVFTNNGINLPQNTVSNGDISICFNGNDQFYEIPPNDNNFKFSVDIEPGNYSYQVTSFVRSSLDGSLIDPCTVPNDYILTTGNIVIQDGSAYEFIFEGSARPLDPRTLAAFKNQTPSLMSRPEPYILGAGIYVDYPDYISSTNFGPLYGSRSLCVDNGVAGPVLVTASGDLGSRLYFDVSANNYAVFPPLLDGTCNTNLDAFTQSTVGVFPSVVLSSDRNVQTAFINFDGLDYTGVSARLVEFADPTPTPVDPTPVTPPVATPVTPISTTPVTPTPTAPVTPTNTTPVATTPVAQTTTVASTTQTTTNTNKTPAKTTTKAPALIRTGGDSLGLGIGMIVTALILLMFMSVTFDKPENQENTKSKRLKTSTNI